MNISLLFILLALTSCINFGSSTEPASPLDPAATPFFPPGNYDGGFTLFSVSGETTRLNFKASWEAFTARLSLLALEASPDKAPLPESSRELLRLETVSGRSEIQALWFDPGLKARSAFVELAARAAFAMGKLNKGEVDDKWNTIVTVFDDKAEVHIADFSGKYSVQISHKDFLASLQFEKSKN